MIHYFLEDDPLKPGKFRATLLNKSKMSQDKFLAFCESSSTLTRADVVAVLERMSAWIGENAANGKEVDFGRLGQTRLGLRVRGGVDSHTKALNPGDVRLSIGWEVSPSLRKQISTVPRDSKLQRHVRGPHRAVIQSVADLATGQPDAFTPGAFLEIKGDNLKFNPQREDEGVFLESSRAKLRVQECKIHRPKLLMVKVPQETFGIQKLVICTRGRSKHRSPSETTYGLRLKPSDRVNNPL